MKNLAFNFSLYCLIAFCTGMSAALSTDDAAKYIQPVTLWWLRTAFGVFGAVCLAAKMFVSTTYAEFQASRTNGNGVDKTIKPTDLPQV